MSEVAFYDQPQGQPSEARQINKSKSLEGFGCNASRLSDVDSLVQLRDLHFDSFAWGFCSERVMGSCAFWRQEIMRDKRKNSIRANRNGGHFDKTLGPTSRMVRQEPL